MSQLFSVCACYTKQGIVTSRYRNFNLSPDLHTCTLLRPYSALMNPQTLMQRIHNPCADQVKEGREGSDEDPDEVTGGVRRGSGDKKRKGDVRA